MRIFCPPARLPVCLALLACARMEPPPGGPPDAAPPQLIATVPDTFADVPDFDDDVEFLFDEVITEGGSPSQGTGTGDLERLVILSPTAEIPRVRWRRNRIAVRPEEGWQRDRVYRVELLPGVTDLRNNRSNRGALVTFTTGGPRPAAAFEGTVVDWTSGRPAPQALVVATKMPDSLPYRGLADSSGRFNLGPLPEGEYVVSGVLDENRNHLDDPREAFDSVRVRSGQAKPLELWAFVHDTSPPRIRTVTATDSTAAGVEFTQSLDPRQRLQPSAVRLSLMPDSTPVKVLSLLPRPIDDSLHSRRPAPRDSAPADTAAAPRRPPPPGAPGARPQGRPVENAPLTSRPPLTDQLVLRPATPWKPGARFTVEIKGVRNVTGVAGDVVGTLVVPERPARDTLAVPADSTPYDSLRQRTDSVRPPAAKPAPTRSAPTRPTPTDSANPAPAKRKPGPTLPAKPSRPAPTTPQ